ncbi:tyrosine-type recombinase/integrase [Metaclostridioides mangenotii]|jgi:integrase|uniref:tyrosine-type recombinase/integrase n=2 Tax=Metaclostridioides mangenotii TaxID=1540 RepID=UPI0004668615|nr:tyrosine-type recombinase/integrase [Clostridioides mangenotii]
MATRPLELDEYKTIIELLNTGFTYIENGKEKVINPNLQTSMALMLEANLGLRISDVLRLKVGSFKRDKLEIREKKTGKLQYRSIDPNISYMISEYALNKGLRVDDNLISISDYTIRHYLRIICRYLSLENISTHSFRKMYATMQYERSNNNLELVKELLNHSSIATTQRYIRVSQKEINKASGSFFIG